MWRIDGRDVEMAGGDQIVAGVRWNESEFQKTAAPVYVKSENRTVAAGVTLFSTCGPNALAMAESWGSQSYVNTMALFARMAPAGRCDSGGAATIDSLRDQAVADGYKVEKIAFTGAGIPEATWRHFLAVHAGNSVVIVETLEGCQLRDLISGQYEDATLSGPNRLQRHFFGIYGLNDGTQPSALFKRTVPAGYITSDGCNGLMNPVVNGARQRVIGPDAHQQLYYPYAVVRASRPAALLAVYPKSATQPPAPSQETPQQTIGRQYAEILADRAQIARQNATIAQLQAVVAAVRAAVK